MAQTPGQDRVEVLDYSEFKAKYLVEHDHPMVFNFWATWCKPCVEEMPYFMDLFREGDVELILVSLDFPQHLHTKLIPFLEANDIHHKVVLLNERNANVYIDDIEPTWQGSIPATLVWKEQKLGFAEQEFHSKEELETFVNDLLKK